MFKMTRWNRSLLFAPLLATAALVAACDDDSTEPEDDPADAIVEMRLNIASVTVTIDRGGNVTPGQLNFGPGIGTISATFVDSEGATVTGLDEFELRVTFDDPFMTYESTGPFTGTLTNVSAGTTQVRFALYHIEEMHEDFGPFALTITTL